MVWPLLLGPGGQAGRAGSIGWGALTRKKPFLRRRREVFPAPSTKKSAPYDSKRTVGPRALEPFAFTHLILATKCHLMI